MKAFSLILLFVFSLSSSYSQLIKINKIEVPESELTIAVEKFITKTKDDNTNFRNKGYLTIMLLFYNESAKQEEIKYSYHITDQYSQLKKGDDESLFPNSYCYFNKKLALFHYPFSPSIKFTTKSKKKLIRKMIPFLNKKEHLKVKDENGKIIINDKYFRDDSYKIHGGMNIHIYGDNTIKTEKAKY